MSLSERIKRDTVISECTPTSAVATYSQGSGVTIRVEMKDGKAITTQPLNLGVGFNSVVRDGMLAAAREAMVRVAYTQQAAE